MVIPMDEWTRLETVIPVSMAMGFPISLGVAQNTVSVWFDMPNTESGKTHKPDARVKVFAEAAQSGLAGSAGGSLSRTTLYIIKGRFSLCCVGVSQLAAPRRLLVPTRVKRVGSTRPLFSSHYVIMRFRSGLRLLCLPDRSGSCVNILSPRAHVHISRAWKPCNPLIWADIA